MIAGPRAINSIAMKKSLRITILVLIIVLFLIGCVEREEEFDLKKKPSSTEDNIISISEILKDPQEYKNSIVTIEGVVEPGLAFEFVNEQPYRVDDGSGKIWVITKGVMPQKGQRVRVRGVVHTPYQIKGRRYQVAVVEVKRY